MIAHSKSTCPCGSDLPKLALHDARGIFCFYYCPKCLISKRAGYRPEIFIDPQYETSEPVEEDD